MSVTRRAFISAMAALSLAACASTQRGADRTASPRTSVRVQNQNFLDMNIYLVQGAQRIRLGTVSGNTTQVLTIPAQFIFGPTSLQFLADPVGANRTPISNMITVSPGEQVTLIIPAG